MIYQRRVRPGGGRRPRTQAIRRLQHVSAPSAFASSPRSTATTAMPRRSMSLARPRVGRAVQEAVARPQGVCGRRLTRINRHRPQRAEDRRIDPGWIHQDVRVGDQRGRRLEMEAPGGRQRRRHGSRTAPGCARAGAIPASFERPPAPTNTVLPATSTSPPSSVPGSAIGSIRRQAASASRVDSVSARRDGAPGRVTTASSSNTTAVSSTNTASGRSGSGRILVDREARLPERLLVGLVLARREVHVDRRSREVRELAAGERGGDGPGQRGEHARAHFSVDAVRDLAQFVVAVLDPGVADDDDPHPGLRAAQRHPDRARSSPPRGRRRARSRSDGSARRRRSARPPRGTATRTVRAARAGSRRSCRALPRPSGRADGAGRRRCAARLRRAPFFSSARSHDSCRVGGQLAPSGARAPGTS